MAKKKAKTAKAKKGAPLPPKDDAVKVGPSEMTPLINERQLRALLASDASHKEELDSVTGSLRAEIKLAVEKHHLDKEMFAILKKFNRWTPEKLADKWPVLLAYMDMAGLMEKIDSVGRLDLGDEAPATGKPGPALAPARETEEAAGGAWDH